MWLPSVWVVGCRLGHRVDCTQFELVLEKIRVPRPEPADPERRLAAWPPGRLAADKACSNGPCHDHPRKRGIRHTIPEKTDSQAARLWEGSRAAGGPRQPSSSGSTHDRPDSS